MAHRASLLVVDDLWNCLCPSFSRRALYIVPRSRTLVQGGRRRQHGASYAPSAPTWSTNSRIASNQTSRIPHTPLTIDAPPPTPSVGVNDVSESLEDTEERLLSQLDHFAEEANKPKVQELLLSVIRKHGRVPDAAHYEALLLAEADPEHGSAGEVERLLNELEVEGIPPDSAVYHAALRALAVHPNYVLRESILKQMEERWFDLNEGGYHSVIAALFRERQFELALERLSSMQAAGYEPKPWLLHLAIATCLYIDAFPEALALLKHRASFAEPVPSALWAECLSKAAHAFCHPLVDFIWRRAVEGSYLNPSSGTCTAVLDTAARYGNFRLATDVFRVLGERASPLQAHHYEALMQAYLTAGDLAAAMSSLGLMANAGHVPDLGAVRPLVHFLAADAATRVPHCLALLAEPLPHLPIATSPTRHDKSPTMTIYAAAAPVLTAALEALIRVNALEAAQSLLSDWSAYAPDVQPGLHVYNALLLGATALPDPSRQRELAAIWLAEMEERGLAPDGTTLERLLVTHLGPKELRVDLDGLLLALACFEKLCEKRVVVSNVVKRYLISKLVRAGQVDAARIVGNAWRNRVIIKEGSIDAEAEELSAEARLVRTEDEEGRGRWMVEGTGSGAGALPGP